MTKITAGTHVLIMFKLTQHNNRFTMYQHGHFVTVLADTTNEQMQSDMNTLISNMVNADPAVADQRVITIRRKAYELPDYLRFSNITHAIELYDTLVPPADPEAPYWDSIPESATIPANTIVTITPSFGNYAADVRLLRTLTKLDNRNIHPSTDRERFNIVESCDAFIAEQVEARQLDLLPHATVTVTFPDYPYTEANQPLSGVEDTILDIVMDQAKNGNKLTENSPELADVLQQARTRGTTAYPARQYTIDDLFIIHGKPDDNQNFYPKIVINWKSGLNGGISQTINDPSGSDTTCMPEMFMKRAA